MALTSERCAVELGPANYGGRRGRLCLNCQEERDRDEDNREFAKGTLLLGLTVLVVLWVALVHGLPEKDLTSITILDGLAVGLFAAGIGALGMFLTPDALSAWLLRAFAVANGDRPVLRPEAEHVPPRE